MDLNLDKVLTGLELAKAQYDELVEKASGPLRAGLSNLVREIGIPGICWDQYTPHFNDGDACIFSVHEPAIILRNADAVTQSYDEDNCIYGPTWTSWKDLQSKDYHEDMREMIAESGLTEEKYEQAVGLAKRLMDLEDVLQHAFGDHKFIKVTPDYVEVEDCEHD